MSPNSNHERSPLLSAPHSNSHSSKPNESPETFTWTRYLKLRGRPRTLLLVSLLLLSSAVIYLYNRANQRDLVDELANSIEGLSTCASCKALLVPLVTIAHLGNTKFYSTLVSFCVGLRIQDREVCEGALGAQAPIIAHSLRSMSLNGETATLFCAKTFGLCDDPPVRDWKNMPLPPQTNNLHEPPICPNSSLLHTSSQSFSSSHSGRDTNKQPTRQDRSSEQVSKTKPLRVIHLSDLHIDREYAIGADTVCKRNLCCRMDQPTNTPDKTHAPAGPYGSHKCDSPASLYISMLRALQDHAPDAAFAVHTGDMVDHAVWKSVRKEVEDGIGQGHSQYQTYSSTPLYGVIGNHDVAPTNSFPRNTTITTLSSQWDLELFSGTWEKWIGEENARTVQTMSGCYSIVHPGTNLKIISLNTGFWYKANFWLYDSDEFQPDPNGILAWLISELQDAEDKGQKAWMMGHLSPGKADCLREPSRYLNQIMRRYKNTISASLYGHTHRSEWEIVYEDPTRPTAESAIGMNYIGPAMTPESGNPAFRIYDVDPETYEILNFHEIITNLSEPGYQSHPRWFKYYSARETYGTLLRDHNFPGLTSDRAPIDGAFWHRVTDILEQSYPEFEKFYRRLTRGADLGEMGDWKPCYSGACRKKWIQILRSSQSEFNGYPNHLGLNINAIDGPTHKEVKQVRWALEPGEHDGEHTCGDLASLYKQAKERLGNLHLQDHKVKISKELRNKLRQRLHNDP
ncbi:hypothetical protein CROQUDRAFT_657362 [Cronartium quercuum f. sp. fusiforme G11]|uniref:Calcineurin-like phosphoesterase domain-containing protein n=1 Tax=Cronartium quercuum f. sp. fusiforme G11 TaxID=708437 RepID=A0A9P6NMU7_9BASI|nr:hypothetical protein CROQUDRAFT_657362 [Cronartium quercuum f. sp. fusiforme G11]